MTTDTVLNWLRAIKAGDVEFRDGRFHDYGNPVNDGANKILTELALSGWAERSGSLIKLTDVGRRELENAR